MTYARFLLVFVITPLVAAAIWKRRELPQIWRPLLALLAVVYLATPPWDAYAVAHGIWEFEASRISGVWTLGVPVEELAFFGLQATLVVLLVHGRLVRRGIEP